MIKNLLTNVTKDGNIRTKKTCPFFSKCSQKTKECPTRGNTKSTQHRCGIARLFTQSEKNKRSLPVLPPITSQPVEQPKQTWNINEAVQSKIAERFKGETWIPQPAFQS